MNPFNQIQNAFNMGNSINHEQFKNNAPKLSKEQLQQLVVAARKQGIPESQIEAGLNFILGMNK